MYLSGYKSTDKRQTLELIKIALNRSHADPMIGPLRHTEPQTHCTVQTFDQSDDFTKKKLKKTNTKTKTMTMTMTKTKTF